LLWISWPYGFLVTEWDLACSILVDIVDLIAELTLGLIGPNLLALHWGIIVRHIRLVVVWNFHAVDRLEFSLSEIFLFGKL
jgi:hypothetical protein